MTRNNYTVTNIREYLKNSSDDGIGEKMLLKQLSGFSCPLNPDVERFLKEQAIEFTKKNQSVTYLVFSNKDLSLVGYFTLTIKPITVREEIFSKRIRRKLARVSEYNKEHHTFHMSAYLIAQFGKNFSHGLNNKITGQQLMEIAIKQVKEAQYILGGMVIFLETEENSKLFEFYTQNNDFTSFDIRRVNSKDDYLLIQMLTII